MYHYMTNVMIPPNFCFIRWSTLLLSLPHKIVPKEALKKLQSI